MNVLYDLCMLLPDAVSLLNSVSTTDLASHTSGGTFPINSFKSPCLKITHFNDNVNFENCNSEHKMIQGCLFS